MSGKGIYNICTGNSNLTLKQGIIVIVYFRWSISFHLRVYRHFYRFRIFFFYDIQRVLHGAFAS